MSHVTHMKAITLELVELLGANLRATAATGARMLTVHRDLCDSAPDFFKVHDKTTPLLCKLPQRRAVCVLVCVLVCV